MQITTEDHGDLLEMRIAGRLDNEWAGHLTDVIDQAVRQGSHAIVLDLSGVSYLSSAGIGVLVRAQKQLQAIRGFFGVGVAPPHVVEVIRLTGLAKMLLCDIEQVRRNSGAGLRSTLQAAFRVSSDAGMNFEVYDLDSGAVMTATVFGDPGRFGTSEYAAADCRGVTFPEGTLGLGLGAFGKQYSECADRLGEFLAVGGAAAQLPTTGTGKADYQRTQGQFVPTMQVAYGVQCRGTFRQMQRFEPEEDGGRIPLSVLADRALALAETDLAAVVFLAETSGLVGARLRRSPAGSSAEPLDRWAHPEIRRWMSFSSDRQYSHSLALVVGILSRSDPARGLAADLVPLLRPLDRQSSVFGHCHAAVFSYRPFKKRKLDLAETISALFDHEDLQSVLHLLHDDRDYVGGGESEFLRGACWIAPLTVVTREPS